VADYRSTYFCRKHVSRVLHVNVQDWNLNKMSKLKLDKNVQEEVYIGLVVFWFVNNSLYLLSISQSHIDAPFSLHFCVTPLFSYRYTNHTDLHCLDYSVR